MDIRRIALWLFMVVLAAAPAGAGPTLAPLVVGWERYFKIESEPVDKDGKPIVRGYVLNDWGFTARRVQLLVESLDASNTVVGQRVEWLVPNFLTPGTRAYFEMPTPTRAARYRVSVYAFDWVQSSGHRTRFP